ncbi:ribonuclease HII [Candidatus Dojkabacteria bacterium]|uniref:Ribonuclease n=1 Tax=Candidatus Dojkabacteria bacterium TaxID=2099670 RepID=A0A955I5L0_9BACT|nr:ribonuclease HII [Candidatus Dojkabacteria bacterium]
MLSPNRELEILGQGKYFRVVGIDEVGRGCWAGPVAVGAYIFSANSPVVAGVNDSKKVSPGKREKIYQELKQGDYLVKMSPASEVDELGISVAIENLVGEIVGELQDDKTFFVVDGRFSRDFGQNTIQVVGGDRTYYSVASASILAKVERDDLMTHLDSKFPGYALAKHKGYGTAAHLAALQNLGATEIHRRSYKPIANLR